MLHDTLWRFNTDLANVCLQHPFVRTLGAGSLKGEAFKCYVAQDAFFLRAFLRAYAIAAAKCDRIDHVRSFHKFMGGVLDELTLHEAYSAKWGIDLADVEPLPATRAYVDFLLHITWHRGVDEIIAAMTPCMRLYAYLGNALARSRFPAHPYRDWIDTYSSQSFQDLTAKIESLLDAVAQDTPAVRDAYRYAMKCEIDFFAAPLEHTK